MKTDADQINIKMYNERLKELIVAPKTMDEEESYSKYFESLRLPVGRPYTLQIGPLYRSRIADEKLTKEDAKLVKSFSYIPLENTTETWPARGRMNRTGQSLFYASLSPDTNYRELKRDIQIGDEIYVARWDLKENAKLNSYAIPHPSNIGKPERSDSCFTLTGSYFAKGEWGEYLKTLSDIFTEIDESESKYILSSCLSNYIINLEGTAEFECGSIPFHYDSILYPSVRHGNGEIRNTNIVITPEATDRCLKLTYVVKGAIKEDLTSLDVHSIGFPSEDKVIWYNLRILEENITFHNIQIITASNDLLSHEENSCTDKKGRIVTCSGFANYMNRNLKESFIQLIIERHLMKESIGYNSITSRSDLLQALKLCMFWPMDGWHMKADPNIAIAAIKFEVECKSALVPEE